MEREQFEKAHKILNEISQIDHDIKYLETMKNPLGLSQDIVGDIFESFRKECLVAFNKEKERLLQEFSVI